MKINNITVGADPELFIIDSNKKVISAVGLIPGEKGNPYRAENMPEGFGLETDNILAEFNIPPVSDQVGFINNILYMQSYIRDFVQNINPSYDIQCIASRLVDKDQLQSKQAQEFGCDIDYNAYTQAPNEKPKGTKTNLRSAGFHIHIGYDNPNVVTSLRIIQWLDIYLGVPSIFIDKDTQRRSLYGKAGCFRLTPYGLEYRTLSSYMMGTTERLKWVYKGICAALAHACRNSIPVGTSKFVQNAINNNDKTCAESIMNYFNINKPCVD